MFNFLVRNKSLNKKKLFAAGFFKFTCALKVSKIIFGANTRVFCGFVKVIISELCAFFINLRNKFQTNPPPTLQTEPFSRPAQSFAMRKLV